MAKRLPAISDFSPGIIGSDIRVPLEIVRENAHSPETIFMEFAQKYCKGKLNKRATHNIPLSLRKLELVDDAPFNTKTPTLTELGERVRLSGSQSEAVETLCSHILTNLNGLDIIRAVQALNLRGEKVSKDNLKQELRLLGVQNLSTATTDHTTILNWFCECDVLDRSNDFEVNGSVLKKLVGVDGLGLSEVEELDTPERIFLIRLRVLVETEEETWIQAKKIIADCLARYPKLYDEDQFRKTIIDKVEKSGWVETDFEGGTSGKSGKIRAKQKLAEIPIQRLMPDFDAVVPGELRKHLSTPLYKIKADLNASSKNVRGFALELLSLRLALDLGLSPKKFRSRSKEEGYAEADLIAEGDHLMFSRWLVQCKNFSKKEEGEISGGGKVDIGHVAREVGLAIYNRSHVIMIVTTGSFTRPAIDYSREVSQTTNLQFVFIKGAVLNKYIQSGSKALIDFMINNARSVMATKSGQLPVSEEEVNEALTAPPEGDDAEEV